MHKKLFSALLLVSLGFVGTGFAGESDASGPRREKRKREIIGRDGGGQHRDVKRFRPANDLCDELKSLLAGASIPGKGSQKRVMKLIEELRARLGDHARPWGETRDRAHEAFDGERARWKRSADDASDRAKAAVSGAKDTVSTTATGVVTAAQGKMADVSTAVQGKVADVKGSAVAAVGGVQQAAQEKVDAAKSETAQAVQEKLDKMSRLVSSWMKP